MLLRRGSRPTPPSSPPPPRPKQHPSQPGGEETVRESDEGCWEKQSVAEAPRPPPRGIQAAARRHSLQTFLPPHSKRQRYARRASCFAAQTFGQQWLQGGFLRSL